MPGRSRSIALRGRTEPVERRWPVLAVSDRATIGPASEFTTKGGMSRKGVFCFEDHSEPALELCPPPLPEIVGRSSWLRVVQLI